MSDLSADGLSRARLCRWAPAPLSDVQKLALTLRPGQAAELSWKHTLTPEERGLSTRLTDDAQPQSLTVVVHAAVDVQGRQVEAFPEAVMVPDLDGSNHKQQSGGDVFNAFISLGMTEVFGFYLEELLAAHLPDYSPQAINRRDLTQQPEEQKLILLRDAHCPQRKTEQQMINTINDTFRHC